MVKMQRIQRSLLVIHIYMHRVIHITTYDIIARGYKKIISQE